MRTEVLRLKPLPPEIPPEEVEAQMLCNGLSAVASVEFNPGESFHILVTRRRARSSECVADTFDVVAPTEPEEFRIVVVEEVH